MECAKNLPGDGVSYDKNMMVNPRYIGFTKFSLNSLRLSTRALCWISQPSSQCMNGGIGRKRDGRSDSLLLPQRDQGIALNRLYPFRLRAWRADFEIFLHRKFYKPMGRHAPERSESDSLLSPGFTPGYPRRFTLGCFRHYGFRTVNPF